MARKRTKAAPIYLSIIAKDHDELVRKIDAIHAGFRQPAPATKHDVRDAINEYAGKHPLAEGRELVQKVCGVDVLSLSQIPEDRYAAVVAAFRAAA